MTTAITSQAPALNEIFKIDPIAKEKNDLFWQSLWKVAEYAAMVIFTIGAVSGFIVTSLYFPSQVFAVTLALYTIGLQYAFRCVNYLSQKSHSYARSALSHGKIVNQLNLIKDEDLPKVLNSLGVTPPAEISQMNLKVAVARYFRMKQDQSALLSKRAALPQSKEIGPVGNIDWKDEKAVDSFNTTQKIRFQRKVYKHEAAITNVIAAYTLKLMQSPYEQRNYEEFFQWNPIDPGLMYVSKAHGDRSTNILVKTPTHQYTAKELLQKDSTTLAREIFELPTPPAPVKSRGWFSA